MAASATNEEQPDRNDLMRAADRAGRDDASAATHSPPGRVPLEFRACSSSQPPRSDGRANGAAHPSALDAGRDAARCGA